MRSGERDAARGHRTQELLFVGNETTGQQTAILLSVTQTCRRLGIDVRAYLTDVLARINNYPSHRLVELLPDRWAREQEGQGRDIRLRGQAPRKAA